MIVEQPSLNQLNPNPVRIFLPVLNHGAALSGVQILVLLLNNKPGRVLISITAGLMILNQLNPNHVCMYALKTGLALL